MRLDVRGYRNAVFQTGYRDTLNDWLLIIITYTPDLVILICCVVEVVVEVAIMRPWRSMMVYLVSGAEVM